MRSCRTKIVSTLLALVMVFGCLSGFKEKVKAALPSLSNVQIAPEGILSWDAFDVAGYYDVEAVSSAGGIYNTCDNNSTSYDFAGDLGFLGFPGGSYTVSITARDAFGEAVSETWTGTYNYVEPTIELAKPSNVRVNGNVITWNAVPNATLYRISLSSSSGIIFEEEYVSTTEFDFAPYLEEGTHEYNYSIQAYGRGYISSESYEGTVNLTKNAQLQNVGFSPEGILTWDEFSGAADYLISFKSATVDDSYSTSWQLFELKDYLYFCDYPEEQYTVSVVACNDNSEPISEAWTGTFDYVKPIAQLEPLSNVQWNGPIATWDAVPNATIYEVCLYASDVDIYVCTSATEFDFSPYLKDGEHEYEVTIWVFAPDYAMSSAYYKVVTMAPLPGLDVHFNPGTGWLEWEPIQGAYSYVLTTDTFFESTSETSFNLKDLFGDHGAAPGMYGFDLEAVDEYGNRISQIWHEMYPYTIHEISIGEFPTQEEGYTVAPEQGVVITLNDTTRVDPAKLEIHIDGSEPDAFEYEFEDSGIMQGPGTWSNNPNFTIRPKLGLGVGTYRATVDLWYDSDDNPGSDLLIGTADISFSVKPQNTCTLTMDANGGITGPDWQDVMYFAEGTIITADYFPDSFVMPPEGKTWDAIEVNGERYEMGETFEVTGPMVAKILWADATWLEFDANGGIKGTDWTDGELVVKGRAITLVAPDEDFVKAPENMVFDAFEIDDVRYEIGASYTPIANAKIKFLWKLAQYTVSFDANGGTKGTDWNDTVVMVYGTNILLTAPIESVVTAPSGKEFSGYEVDGVSYPVGTQLTVTKDITIKFIWTDVPPTPEPPTPEPGPDTPTPEPTTPTPEPAKDPSFEDFVERLYTVALGRASEPEGKAYWVEQVVKNGFTGADCARFFMLGAPEFLGRNLTDDEFVEVLYKTYFDRESEPDGKAYWMGRLASGTERAVLVEEFIESVEWCNVCAGYGVKSGAQYHKATVPSKNAVKFATRLYTCCLGRDPEEEGLQYWALALTNLDATGYQAASLFFTLPEFVGLKTTNEEYLTRLYTTFMGREPEADGFAYWLGLLNGGTDRVDVMKAFAGCPEFQEICNQYGIVRGEI